VETIFEKIIFRLLPFIKIKGSDICRLELLQAIDPLHPERHFWQGAIWGLWSVLVGSQASAD